MNQINFKKIDKLDNKLVNWFDPDLLRQCSITSIKNVKTSKNMKNLLSKNDLQHKIMNHQFAQLINIYRNISIAIADFYDADEEYSRQDLQMINNANYSHEKLIKKYGDLDLLSKLRTYRTKHPNITCEDMIDESIYIKELIVISTLQQVILDQQVIKLLTITETILRKILLEHTSEGVDEADIGIRSGKEIIPITKRIRDIQRDRDAIVIYKFDLSKEMPTVIFDKKSKKMFQPIKIDLPDACRVCFENIEHRIALVACGHTSVCQNCVNDIDECPTCATPYTQHIKIFIE